MKNIQLGSTVARRQLQEAREDLKIRPKNSEREFNLEKAEENIEEALKTLKEMK